jgi:HlyD family secretion protein
MPWKNTPFAFFLIVALSACSDNGGETFQGYVEGDFVYIASPLGGQLDVLSVRRGENVTAGVHLFSLESAFEKALVHEAANQRNQALDRLANLQKGQRPSEIAAIEARLNQASSAMNLAKAEFGRRKKLFTNDDISKATLDKSEDAFTQNAQKVKQISAELKTARLGGRPDEIRAAENQVDELEAKMDQAKWKLEQKAQNAPRSGLVFDTLYHRGEWVKAGAPVISILPPENIKIRFFVSESIVGQLSLNQEMTVSYDGGEPFIAGISFISPQVQYTPPIIYSNETRAKLVYMVEARPSADQAARLHPGQPVSLRRAPE